MPSFQAVFMKTVLTILQHRDRIISFQPRQTNRTIIVKINLVLLFDIFEFFVIFFNIFDLVFCVNVGHHGDVVFGARVVEAAEHGINDDGDRVGRHLILQLVKGSE